MRCPSCGTDNPAGNNYCKSCGARLVSVCGQCGHLNPLTGRFCGSCGASLHTDAPRAANGGERKQATVLFADVAGSTQLIADLDPEQAMERLRPIVTAMCAAVLRFDGTVVRTLGDGIMAIFGAPRAQEGHALLACEAALAMQEALRSVEAGPKIRIGLHSGEVVSGFSDFDQKPGPHGATVHMANRVQQMAEPGGICLTEYCFHLVRPYCDVLPLGRQGAKGFPEPVEVYRLLGLKPAVASQQFRATKLTCFRGRDHEMDVLHRALGSAQNRNTKGWSRREQCARRQPMPPSAQHRRVKHPPAARLKVPEGLLPDRRRALRGLKPRARARNHVASGPPSVTRLHRAVRARQGPRDQRG
jgi:class 3 adenylate cyclase